MTLEALIQIAVRQGASDLHLEAGLPAAVRVRGALRTFGDPIAARVLFEWAQTVIGVEAWAQFVERRSFDLSRSLSGVRCRMNILQTSRGVGFAIRLLAGFEATIEKLNLHPDLKKLAEHTTGLVLVSGPTGSGKSSTLAALIQEINLNDTRHIVTIESPIEYTFRPRKSYLRQREVGRDTPSFEQALLDALREDPDVLMVGEMREPATMRLTLNAAETGHLVLATVHSSTCIEALQRIVSAFPAEIQGSVSAQLADCLVAVIAQRLQFRPDLNLRLPECEILIPTNPVKAHIRNRDFFKIASVLETGAESGLWTFHRYRTWMGQRKQWFVPEPATFEAPADPEFQTPPELPRSPMPKDALPEAKPIAPSPPARPDGRIEIEPVEGPFGKILKR